MQSKIKNVRIGERFFYRIDDCDWIIFQITKTSIGYGHRYYHWKVICSHGIKQWASGDDHYNWIASTFDSRDVIRLSELSEEEVSRLIFSEMI